jgi:hypothetical protein
MTSVCQECGKAITASRKAVEYPKDHPTPNAIPHADMKFWHVRCAKVATARGEGPKWHGKDSNPLPEPGPAPLDRLMGVDDEVFAHQPGGKVRHLKWRPASEPAKQPSPSK